MSELIAFSFDSDASPALRFQESTGAALPGPGARPGVYGWGVGWYPDSERGASVLKDPTSSGDGSVGDVLRDWRRFRSTHFVCHLRGHARRRTQQDAQPFLRSYGGRQWIFAHDGDLERDYAGRIALGGDPSFEPLGRTDSEHAFCWMLERLHARRVRSLSEVPPEELREWFLAIDAAGQCNAVLSDGDLLAVYRDGQQRGGLSWTRRIPPHETTSLQSDAVRIDLDAPEDGNRTALVFSSVPLSGEGWLPMAPSQLVLARRGSVIWDSDPGAAHDTARPAYAGGYATARSEAAPQMPGSEPLPEPGGAPLLTAPERVLTIVHETLYRYASPVERSSHRLLLRPAEDRRQQVRSYQLELSPYASGIDYEDVFGNAARSVEITEPYQELAIRSRATVRVTEPISVEHSPARRRETIPLVWMPWQRQMLAAYLLPAELPETQLRELSDFAMSFVQRNDSDLVGTLLDMNQTLYRDFEYLPGTTTSATTAFDVLESRRGVCQDFANLMICMARLLSVPARYRMGYIFTGADYQNKIQSEASHAWVELYLPRVGWLGFDPTNGRQAGSEHVRVACGRNYLDATPTSGTIYRGGGTETLTVSVRVEDAV